MSSRNSASLGRDHLERMPSPCQHSGLAELSQTVLEPEWLRIVLLLLLLLLLLMLLLLLLLGGAVALGPLLLMLLLLLLLLPESNPQR